MGRASGPYAFGRLSVAGLFLCVFLGMGAFALMIPVLVLAARDLTGAAELATLTLALYSFSAFLSGPVLGRLSDRLGRRPVLVATYGVAAFGYAVLHLMGGSFWGVLAGLAIAGLMSGNMSVVLAAVADRTQENRRVGGMGMIGAAIGLAFTIGPGVGGYLGADEKGMASIALPAQISAVLMVMATLSALVLVRTPKSDTAHTDTPRIGFGGMKTLAGSRAFLSLVLVIFGVTASLSMMEASLPLALQDTFDFSTREIGRLFLLVGGVMILVQGGLVRILQRRFAPHALVRPGLAIMASGLALMGFPLNPYQVAAGVVLVVVGYGVATSALAALKSLSGDQASRGLVMSGYQSAQALARAVGPLVAGFLYADVAQQPFMVGAAIVLLVMPVFGYGVPKGVAPDAPLEQNS